MVFYNVIIENEFEPKSGLENDFVQLGKFDGPPSATPDPNKDQKTIAISINQVSMEQ